MVQIFNMQSNSNIRRLKFAGIGVANRTVNQLLTGGLQKSI